MVYEMVLNLLIFALLWRLRQGEHKRGFITSVYLITYSVGRSLISFFRAGSLWVGPIRAAHLISIIIVIAFGYFLLERKLYRTG
jgi:phosphatidylglycerol:prolipoprotein diacylglycerol transferase